MHGYVCSMGTNFFIQDFAPGAEVPMVRRFLVLTPNIALTSLDREALQPHYRLLSHGWGYIPSDLTSF